jgi:hypothetical protein
MREIDVHMVSIGTAAATLTHLLDHAAGNEVAGCEVLLMWGIALHEALAL